MKQPQQQFGLLDFFHLFDESSDTPPRDDECDAIVNPSGDHVIISSKRNDWGEKIGGARKDLAHPAWVNACSDLIGFYQSTRHEGNEVMAIHKRKYQHNTDWQRLNPWLQSIKLQASVNRPTVIAMIERGLHPLAITFLVWLGTHCYKNASTFVQRKKDSYLRYEDVREDTALYMAASATLTHFLETASHADFYSFMAEFARDGLPICKSGLLHSVVHGEPLPDAGLGAVGRIVDFGKSGFGFYRKSIWTAFMLALASEMNRLDPLHSRNLRPSSTIVSMYMTTILRDEWVTDGMKLPYVPYQPDLWESIVHQVEKGTISLAEAATHLGVCLDAQEKVIPAYGRLDQFSAMLDMAGDHDRPLAVKMLGDYLKEMNLPSLDARTSPFEILHGWFPRDGWMGKPTETDRRKKKDGGDSPAGKETSATDVDAPSGFPRRKMPIPRFDHLERIGPARREGDITEAMLAQAFGLRGIEYGNWVTQNERQVLLNESYDALADMSEALDVPRQAMGFYGRLALALGARGCGGKAAAHYETGRMVINMTKTTGPGAFGHEWSHALDHYLSECLCGFGPGSLTYASEGERNPVRLFLDGLKSHARRSENAELRLARREGLRAPLQDLFMKRIKEKGRGERLIQSITKLSNGIGHGLNAADLSMMLAGKAADLVLEGGNASVVPFFSWAFTRKAGQWVATREHLFASVTATLAESGMPTATAEKAATCFCDHGLADALRSYASDFQDFWKKIDRAGQNTLFYISAQQLDQGKNEKYWTTGREMFARGFSAVLHDLIAEHGMRNDYASIYSSPRIYSSVEFVASPNPEGIERICFLAEAKEELLPVIRKSLASAPQHYAH